MGNGAMKIQYGNPSPESSSNINNNMTLQQEVGRTYNMERMKKILSSPSSRKKNITPPPPSNRGNPVTSSGTAVTERYIGESIQELVRRENKQIPHLVTKVCSYIQKHGMESEGVFRVNANSRLVDKLRASFDQTGDADLEETDDVMAVAGLLKLFLRELPEGLIPEHLTKLFVNIQEQYASQHELCLRELRSLLQQLQPTEYETLKYLAKFLVLISRKAAINKMNPMALGIVFGPNLFRCTGGIQGLKDQGITNHIALKFITCYDQLFLEDGELSPNNPGFVLKTPVLSKKVAPPRPPPPTVEANTSPPMPSPRKSKNKPNGTISNTLLLPKFELDPDAESGNHSDEEYLDTNRSSSPFALESDRSEFSTMASPRIPPPPNEALDNVIHSAIKELLFGEPASEHSSDESVNSQNKFGPVPAPRRKRRQGDKPEGATSVTEKGELERQLSVKDRISRLQSGEMLAETQEDGRPKKQRPTSKAFEMFEKQGIIMGMAPANKTINIDKRPVEDEDDSPLSSGRNSPNQAVPISRNPPKRPSSPPRIHATTTEQGSDFSDPYENIHNPLRAFKRPSGPSNRRTPSRPQRRDSNETPPMEAKISSNNNELREEPPKPRPFLEEIASTDNSQDVNHNATKPSISFLNQRDDLSPEKSPTATRKPYVPPLDLSILHEHGDGSDPIPVEHGYSVTLQKKVNQYTGDDVAVLSPRMSKFKFKKSHGYYDNQRRYDRLHTHHHGYQPSSQSDTDVPPSPPTEQIRIPSKRGVDDENTVLIKQLTKKIQSCKKRIKVFEEGFEQEHGYRPSQTDKVSQPDIKRSMLELQKARKELRMNDAQQRQMQGQWPHVFTFDEDPLERFNRNAEVMTTPLTDPRNHEVKEDAENEKRAANSSPSGLAVLPNGRTSYDDWMNSPEQPPTMDQTLQVLLKKLTDKRTDENRPEELAEQTLEETTEEKLAVQKALLQFESIHGRPTTKAEKSLMRPLYDRYRNIKRILSKPRSPRDKAFELQSVPEGQQIEFTPTPSTAYSTNRDPMLTGTREEGEDFMVTKDFRLMKDTLHVVAPPGESVSPDGDDPARTLHELTVPQLLDEQHQAKSDKRRLRKILREFEEDFFKQNGSKIQKEDRAPMESEYQEYKQVKARLKLLDALLSKHDPLSAY